jgi:hypothetical protein
MVKRDAKLTICRGYIGGVRALSLTGMGAIPKAAVVQVA